MRVFEGCANSYLGDVEDANIVKLHRFSGKVSYLSCPQFERHPHPPVRRTIKLSLRNLFLQCIDHTENKNPLLLDRKERMIEPDHPWQQRFARFSLLFVADDYRGFDVAASKARSERWISLGDVDRSRIGRKTYWEDYVVPRLNNPQESLSKDSIEQSGDQWVRSVDVRKALRLSTCELAHKRESGEIESKKVGNAYYYKQPKSPS
ncbi:MAG: hypothetical protein ACK5GD_18195 [Planctomycetota bacterium]